MALQTQNFVMVGLGTLGDTPPHAEQPPLVDGIHLRWAFKRELGFPWHGFYLFRRIHLAGDPARLSPLIGDLRPGSLRSAVLDTSIGRFSSDRDLPLTDDFPASGRVEIDLASIPYLCFTLPPGKPARWVEVRIGLRRDVAGAATCVSFRDRQRGNVPNPYAEQGVRFVVREHDGRPAPQARIDGAETTAGQLTGLECGFTVEIDLPCVASPVELTLTHFSAPASVEAFDKNGNRVAVARMRGPARRPETVRLEGLEMVRLIIRAPQDELLLHDLCFTCADDRDNRPSGIRITGLLGDVPVVREWMTGRAGQVVSALLEFDAITSVEISRGPAALVDLCVVPVSQSETVGWEPVPDFPYPMCLPVTHPDYPCSGRKPVDRAAAEARALGRVLYGPPVGWAGAPFADLHEQLLALVAGGPGGTPMADRFAVVPGQAIPPDPNVASPTMPRQRPLDLVLLGSLHPAVAQMVGLYWADQRVDQGVAYDYLIVADASGRGGGQAQKMLSLIQQTGFHHVDGYIVFDKRAEPAPALAAPRDLRAYALPGSTFRAQNGGLIDATNNVGLRWRLEVTDFGALLPGRALMYHVWRATLGDGLEPIPPGNYDLVTKERPLLVAEPPLSAAVRRAADWPPFSLHFIDSGLSDGWYSFQLNGIDIFGRYSPNSVAGPWYQWAPAPAPRPWYYQDPPSDAAIHPFAVRLLDKIPPPPPTGVEAYALDPADPLLLRDAAYAAWQATLSPAERTTLIGLRVRWQWTEAHMRQAPDAREFRIYYHPGSSLPPSHSLATSWHERHYMVGYNQHVTTTTDAAGRPLRVYEVLLPAGGDTFRAGLSLTPTLADPIQNAHIGVSTADDKIYTPDAPKWAAGRWGGRTGNEGRVGAPAMVFRVRRELPDPPAPPADAERVYATPADYHSRSFYTYRWRPSAGLKAHIFRALDDALFKADWSQRPRPALAAAQTQYFPDTAIEPRWNQAKRAQVANELNQLNSFGHNAAGTAQAMAYYRGLSNDGLRVLAGLDGVERAFAQITITPLDPNNPANANRIGPDNPSNFPVDPSLRAYVDTLDGRSSNRYFYRATYIDGAHNRSALSLAGPPVWLPDVVPPARPALLSATGGDRAITLLWVENGEADLDHYLLYRADTREATRDLRLMARHKQVAISPGATARPGEVLPAAATDAAGNPVARRLRLEDAADPNVTYYYRLVAVDASGNPSEPSPVVGGRAYQPPPSPPDLAPPAWDATHQQITLSWTSPDLDLESRVERRTEPGTAWQAASPWLPRGQYTYVDMPPDPAIPYEYRIKVRDTLGQVNSSYQTQTTP